jgi:hypothetical protein
MTPKLKENYVLVYCSGLCGTFWVFRLDELTDAIHSQESQESEELEYKDIKEFADACLCDVCSTSFVLAIENLGVKPLTLNDDSEPH